MIGGMTIKSWLDRLLGRTGQTESDTEAARASMRGEESATRAPETVDDLEEGMHAGRDEVSERHEPMPPPGTG